MSQLVPDLFQAEPGINQSARTGVPEGMRPPAFPRPRHRQKTVAHQVVESAGRERAERSFQAYKYIATFALRPSMA